MRFNTIILVDENQENKAVFMEKLKKQIKISYTKLEVLLQAIVQTYSEEYRENKQEKLYIFLKELLKNLSSKDEMYLIDVDNLLVKNAIKLAEENENIMIIYLRKIEDQERIKTINIQFIEEVENFINEIVKRKGHHG